MWFGQFRRTGKDFYTSSEPNPKSSRPSASHHADHAKLAIEMIQFTSVCT